MLINLKWSWTDLRIRTDFIACKHFEICMKRWRSSGKIRIVDQEVVSSNTINCRGPGSFKDSWDLQYVRGCGFKYHQLQGARVFQRQLGLTIRKRLLVQILSTAGGQGLPKTAGTYNTYLCPCWLAVGSNCIVIQVEKDSRCARQTQCTHTSQPRWLSGLWIQHVYHAFVIIISEIFCTSRCLHTVPSAN